MLQVHAWFDGAGALALIGAANGEGLKNITDSISSIVTASLLAELGHISSFSGAAPTVHVWALSSPGSGAAWSVRIFCTSVYVSPTSVRRRSH